ncbi:MAG: GNAT family N-acetyltransferase [Limisphaerales bacterium]
MNDEDFLHYFDQEVRHAKGIVAADYRREIADGVRRTIGPFPAAPHNWIDHCDADDLPACIEAQKKHYAGIGHSFRWKVYSHDQPQDLADQLVKRGFNAWEEKAELMILDLSELDLREPEGFTFERLRAPERLAEELKPIMDQVWTEGSEDLVTALASEMATCGDHVTIYAAKQDGRTVGSGVLRFGDSFTFGGLFAGATIPSARGQGVYRGIVAFRANVARQLGAKFLYTEAGSMSRPILERLGFKAVATITNYVCE